MSERTLANRALLVEPGLVARRSVIRDLWVSGVARSVFGAGSYSEGLRKLSTHSPTLCFLGPSFSRKSAEKFIAAAKWITGSGRCTFMLLRQASQGDAQMFRDIGAHGVIGFPFPNNNLPGTVRALTEDARIHQKITSMPA